MFYLNGDDIHSSDGYYLSDIGRFRLTHHSSTGNSTVINFEKYYNDLLINTDVFLETGGEAELILQQCRSALEWAGYSVQIFYADGIKYADGSVIHVGRDDMGYHGETINLEYSEVFPGRVDKTIHKLPSVIDKAIAWIRSMFARR